MITMNIFDFIPKHLRDNLMAEQGSVSSIGSLTATNQTTSRAFTSDLGQSTEALAPETTTILHEWEQTCYSAWVEMEQDICGCSVSVSQS